MEDETRFWIMDLDRLVNVPDLLRSIADGKLVGLVDEEAGGIVAYVIVGNEDELALKLNGSDIKSPNEAEDVPAVYPGTEDDQRAIRKANDDTTE